jgi:hypothetical protein
MFSAPMKNVFARASFLAALAALAVSVAAAQALRNHFESDALGTRPAFFDFTVLGAPGAAAWRVTGGKNPPSAPNYVAQIVDSRPKDSIATALRRNSLYRDGSWSVALMRGAARGGIVFRMANEKDFLVLLVNLATGQASLTRYHDGSSKELAKGQAAITNEWGFLKISGAGEKIAATWDGKPLLEAADPSPEAGRAGMATAGAGIAYFDEFNLDPSEKPEKP